MHCQCPVRQQSGWGRMENGRFTPQPCTSQLACTSSVCPRQQDCPHARPRHWRWELMLCWRIMRLARVPSPPLSTSTPTHTPSPWEGNSPRMAAKETSTWACRVISQTARAQQTSSSAIVCPRPKAKTADSDLDSVADAAGRHSTYLLPTYPNPMCLPNSGSQWPNPGPRSSHPTVEIQAQLAQVRGGPGRHQAGGKTRALIFWSNPCIPACSSALPGPSGTGPATHPENLTLNSTRYDTQVRTAAGDGDQPELCAPITVGDHTQSSPWPERRHVC
jgi:hypothetical protein